MTPFRRALKRDLLLVHRRVELVVKLQRDGVYIKGRSQHWKSALYLSWQSLYDHAAKDTAIRKVRERKEKQLQRGQDSATRKRGRSR